MAGRDLFADDLKPKPKGRDLFAEKPPAQAQSEAGTPPQEEADSEALRKQIGDFVLGAPGGPELAEFGSAVSRGATGLVDFFATESFFISVNPDSHCQRGFL